MPLKNITVEYITPCSAKMAEYKPSYLVRFYGPRQRYGRLKRKNERGQY